MKPCYLVAVIRAPKESRLTDRTCVRADLFHGSLLNRLTTELIEFITGDELRCIEPMRSFKVVQLEGEPEGQTWGLSLKEQS